KHVEPLGRRHVVLERRVDEPGLGGTWPGRGIAAGGARLHLVSLAVDLEEEARRRLIETSQRERETELRIFRSGGKEHPADAVRPLELPQQRRRRRQRRAARGPGPLDRVHDFVQVLGEELVVEAAVPEYLAEVRELNLRAAAERILAFDEELALRDDLAVVQ